MCIKKHILVKNNVTKQFMEWKHADSPIKKNFQAQSVSKEGHAVNLLGYKRTDHFDFLEKGATVNSASGCQLFN